MALITSNTGSFNWTDTTAWVGGAVPLSTDTVEIVSGSTITFNRLDTSTTCVTLTVDAGAVLTFSQSMTTAMFVGDDVQTGSVFTLNGTLNMGTVASPMPAAYSATLNLLTPTYQNWSAMNINSSGSAVLNLNGSVGFNANSTTLGGYGTGTYVTTTSADAAVGTNTLVLTDDLGLRATGGDLLAIGCHTKVYGDYSKSEFIQTTAYNSATKTVTLASNLVYIHYAGAYIANTTRNVTIQSPSSGSQAAGINANYVGSTGTSTINHACFSNICRLNASGNEPYIFGSKTYVGCSFYGIFNCLYGFCAWKFINCVWANNSYGPYAGNNFNLINYGAAIGLSTMFMYSESTQTTIDNFVFNDVNGLFNSCSGTTVNNCVAMYGSNPNYTSGGSIANTYNNCTFSYIQYFLLQNVADQFNNCDITCQYVNYAYLDQVDVIFRGGSFYSSAGWQNLGYLPGPSNRLVRYSNVNISGTNTIQCIYNGGRLTQQTSATCPTSGVFPLPSNSSYVGQLLTFGTAANQPVRVRYSIPVVSGQTFNFQVPVYLTGWTVLPTNTQMYLELSIPGVNTNPVSTTTVTSQNTWSYLSVIGTAAATGWMICDFYMSLPRQTGSTYLYLDFPLNMASASLVWFDGIPSEQLTPLSATPAGDVWNYQTNTSTPNGSTLQEVNTLLKTGTFIALK